MGTRKKNGKHDIEVQIKERLRAIVQEVLRPSDETLITDTTSWTEELDADSLDMVEIAMDAEELIQELFGVEIQIPEEEIGKLTTIEKAAAWLQDHLPRQKQ